MTERMTVEELRAAGLAGGWQTTDHGGQLELRRTRQDVERRDAFLAFLRRLLERGHRVRLEHRFDHARRWRFDVALLDERVAVEMDGGGWVGGAHHRAAGRDRDNEKDARAQALGWRVLRVTWDDVRKGEALRRVEALTTSSVSEQGGEEE